MPLIRRQKPGTPPDSSLASDSKTLSTVLGLARRKTIPIRAVDSPQERTQRAAYVPPANAPKPYHDVDYAAVIARYEAKVKNPRSAIRARCIQCCNGQLKEVSLCPATTCALHPFRLGENPFNLRTKAKKAGMSLDAYKALHGGGAEEDDE